MDTAKGFNGQNTIKHDDNTWAAANHDPNKTNYHKISSSAKVQAHSPALTMGAPR